MSKIEKCDHVVLTSHPHTIYKDSPKVNWGAKKPKDRGPIIGTLSKPTYRNCIGTHSGSYSIYSALSQVTGDLKRDHIADLTDTDPVVDIGPFESWYDPSQIVSIDPWGARVIEDFTDEIKKGVDIRPTIAVTKAHINLPELSDAVEKGRIKIDGKMVKDNHNVVVTKAAIEPVWNLPGLAKKIGCSEGELRKGLFRDTGGMFPELVTRPDLKILLPPIGGCTIYIFGDHTTIPDVSKELTVRVHDECNGSDVFGSDICTCRPYLIHGIEECIKTAQRGGAGIIVYFRKEGRALGEVTKYLVYNARKRQEGGDTAKNYFKRTECVAGVEDMRFQEMMPDPLHWIGVKQIDNLISMSDMKYNAIEKSGIKIINRYSIPDELIPTDAQVEIEAKKAHGYFTEDVVKDDKGLDGVKGRGFDE
jgi:GTP cyclohydrolase II